jgi:hypothetical protein
VVNKRKTAARTQPIYCRVLEKVLSKAAYAREANSFGRNSMIKYRGLGPISQGRAMGSKVFGKFRHMLLLMAQESHKGRKSVARVSWNRISKSARKG